jgi:hypothetical protein
VVWFWGLVGGVTAADDDSAFVKETQNCISKLWLSFLRVFGSFCVSAEHL